MDRVAAATGGKLPDTETLVLRARRGTLDEPPVRDQTAALVAELAKLPGVALVADPAGPLGRAMLGVDPVTADRRTALIAVMMKADALAPDLDAVHRLLDVARAYDDPQLQIEMSGPGTTMIESADVSSVPLVLAVLASILLVGVTLRSRVGVLVCLAPAATSAVLAVAVVSWLARSAALTSFAPIIAAVLAFGTCLGGAVVIVYRTQSALLRGEDRVEAVLSVMATSGGAVIVGGLGLSIAMIIVDGLGLDGFEQVASAAAAAAMTTVLVIVTMLPALLVVGGPRLLGWAERHHLATAGTGLGRRPGLRSWWAAQVGRYPAIITAGAGVLLVGLAAQSLGLRIGGGDAGSETTSLTSRRAYDLISQNFGAGVNGPVLVTVDGIRGTAPAAGGAVTPSMITAMIAGVPGVKRAEVSLADDTRGTAIIRVLPTAGPRTSQASELISRLRDDTLPPLLHGTATTAHIGGPTALFDDGAATFRASLPTFLAIVLATSALVTFLLARSIVLAIVLGASSTLSVLAAAGTLRILFQDQQFADMLGVTTSPVEPFVLVPVMVSAFGLSLGMNLALLGRLREAGPAGPGRLRGSRDPLRNRGALRDLSKTDRGHGSDHIRRGHADLGHVILTMNMIMIFAFAAIAAQSPRTLKMIGFGVAAGLAVDALVLRMAVLPAATHLVHRRQKHHPMRPRAVVTMEMLDPETTMPLFIDHTPGRHRSRTRYTS
ncbi:MMPL family transporter [Frankia sp. Cpl3]|nr:MMPL family transporter [Frankia sp. Cpl3]